MSVAVDGAQRYTWPVSTGRPGYDTPNGAFKVNRMDANHFSQEWDNAPMPHTMFFDMHGHAIHGFFDVKHLGLAVSHGCVRLAPANATVLFNLVKAEGMANTSVTVTGRTPGGDNGPVARAACRTTKPSIRRSRRRATASNRRLVMASSSLVIMASNSSRTAAQPGYGHPPGYSQQQPGYGQQLPPQPPPVVTASSRITASAFTAKAISSLITVSPTMGSSRSHTTASSSITDSRSLTTGASSRRIERPTPRRRVSAAKNGIGFGSRC